MEAAIHELQAVGEQFFLRLHYKALSVAAVRVGDPNRSPLRINGCDTAPTPTGFAQIVSHDFPVFHALSLCAFTKKAGNVIEAHDHAGEFKEW